MRIVIGSLLLLLSACSLEKKVEENALYYNVQGMLQEVESNLQQKEVQLLKEVTFRNNESDTLLLLDSVALKEEFDVFREADINRPVLRGRYTVDSLQEGQRLKVRYVAEAPEDMNIDTLEVWLNQEGEPLQMRAYFSDKNPLYQSERELQLSFQPVNGSPLPQSYQISGKQHMIFQDTVSYQVVARFRY